MYLIRNPKTDLYWSNTEGWVGSLLADRFTGADKAELNLPMEGVWVSLWEVDHIQFARLITEWMMAGGFEDQETMGLVADSMDLDAEDIQDIIERAEQYWEKCKGLV